MGNVQDGAAEPAMNLDELGARGGSQLRIQVGKRLVEQEGDRVAHQGAAQRHPLLLPTAQLPGPAPEQALDAQHRRGFVDSPCDLDAFDSAELQTEGQVVRDRHVRIEGVVLEHDREVAIRRIHVVDDAAVDPDLAGTHFLEPRDHPQRGRLSAARGPQQHHELAVPDLEIHVIDRNDVLPVNLGDAMQSDSGHGVNLSE